MGYEINVALKGKHFFATHERSLTTHPEAEAALKLFKRKFPKKQGYEVSITFNPKVGYICQLKNNKLINPYYDEKH